MLVYNAADKVDEVTLRASGPLADWIVIEPPQLPLMPETEGAFSIALALPKDAPLEAGEHPLMLEAWSGLPDSEPSIEERHIEVGRVTGASLALRRAPADRPDGIYEVVVDSRANHRLDMTVDASAPVPVTLEDRSLQLQPFGRATTTFRIEPSGPGDAPIVVSVTATGERLDLRSEVVHVPRTVQPEPPAPEPPAPSPGGQEPGPPPPAPQPEPEPCISKVVLLAAGLAAATFLVLVGPSSRGRWIVVVAALALWGLFGYAGCRIMASKHRSRRAGWLLGLLLNGIGLVIAAVLSPRQPRKQPLDEGAPPPR